MQLIPARAMELAGLPIFRVLPRRARRMVGPFIFLDEMGPHEWPANQGFDVKPHPHIGLATFTYLYQGALTHRDSLGVELVIEPGAINLMTAGKGISHSERSPEKVRGAVEAFHGLQFWLALDHAHEQCEPDFVHTPAEQLPLIQENGVELRVLAGSYKDQRSPVKCHSDFVAYDLWFRDAGAMSLDANGLELGCYATMRGCQVDGQALEQNCLAVIENQQQITIAAEAGSRVVVFGGPAFGEDREIWWNFVASDAKLIDAAREQWGNGQFPAVPGETEIEEMPKR